MLVGTADIEELAARSPVIDSLGHEAAAWQEAEVLQVMYEIATPHREALLPPALHPTDPPIVTWLFYRCPASPWGPFAMAQTRIECRSGLRLRAFLVGAAVDNPAAADALRKHWGYATGTGQVELHRYYDCTHAAVVMNGRAVLDIMVADPDPLSPADVQYVANVNLARTPRGLRLVQVEPRYQIHRVERGRPRLQAFDAAAWGDARLQPVYPVSASLAVADISIPRIRFVCRADVLAFDGTEAVS